MKYQDDIGAIRWIIRDAGGQPPRGIAARTTYPTEAHARAHCAPGEEPVAVRVVARTGPFSDAIEVL